MKEIMTIPTPSCDCHCGSGQRLAEIPCPLCDRAGVTVKSITPQHTLKRAVAASLEPDHVYHFCENPDCDVVYYSGNDSRVFTTEVLKNRVTIKDESPETPLCYCFKVLKKQVLEEIARTGTTDVYQTIQSRMKPGQSCFCEKSNPRGDCCTADIAHWLEAQGVVVNREM